jgi:hypothetical protein
VRASNVAGAATAASAGVIPGSDGSSPVGVSIYGGAAFVSWPEVKLTIHEHEGATAVVIANDGGFADASIRRIAADDLYPWTLASGGAERLPKTVYVRFQGAGIDPAQTYSDDAILDESPPRTIRAKLKGRKRGRRLVIRARDELSGVAKVDLAVGGGDNYTRHRYSPVIRGRELGRIIFVRAVDGAGNPGNWTRVRRHHG